MAVEETRGEHAGPPLRVCATLRVVRYDSFRHHRRSIRLPGHDYSSHGAYFITLCTSNRECLFGEVRDGSMALSPLGKIVVDEWEKSAALRPTLRLDAFVVMPNHIHGIVTIMVRDVVGAHSCAPLRALLPAPLQRPPRSLASFVAQFKATAARHINALRGTPGTRIWQRNYYEHVIRGEEDYYRIQAYIEDNPRRWAEDEYHPSRAG